MSESGGSGYRVLGIDPGEKRIGLAISDPLGVTAQGLETFEVGKGIDFIDFLRDLVDRYRVTVVVLGAPLALGGKEIEGTERSRRFADRIRRELGIEVVLRDERMTSLEAERVLEEGGGLGDAGNIDRLSAVLLLQSYLDEKGT